MAFPRRLGQAAGPVLLITVGLIASIPAMGATVTGTLTVTADLGRAAEEQASQRSGGLKTYYWRVPNGAIDTRDPVVDPTRDLVVVMEPKAGPAAAPPGEVREVHIKGARFDPAVVAVTPRTEVRFVNDDPFIHTPVCAENPAMATPQNISPGQGGIQIRFDTAGIYRIVDRRMPHMLGYVVVVQTPYIARPAAGEQPGQATFTFENVPAGEYVVKVFHAGTWVGQQDASPTDQQEAGLQMTLPSTAQPPDQQGAPAPANAGVR